MSNSFKEAALQYHRLPTPGKIKITPTKSLTTQQDLSLAYSPGVAAASELIHENPAAVCEVTARGNLVGVISDGSAVLGLGNIGPLAAKPVMEGKGVLFKKFADIDVFDIEINEQDPDKLIEIIASLEPTFGGINLEDIKAPGAFQIESALRERLNIPVFHDDQHGTAIITAAAVLNALQIVGKNIEDVVLAASGAGAAGIGTARWMGGARETSASATAGDVSASSTSRGSATLGASESDNRTTDATPAHTPRPKNAATRVDGRRPHFRQSIPIRFNFPQKVPRGAYS